VDLVALVMMVMVVEMALSHQVMRARQAPLRVDDHTANDEIHGILVLVRNQVSSGVEDRCQVHLPSTLMQLGL